MGGIGSGKINGKLVYVFSQDFTVFGGSLSEAHAEKICKIMDMAMKAGLNIGIMIWWRTYSGGCCSLAGYAEVFQRNVLASGVVPQISVIMGPCWWSRVFTQRQISYLWLKILIHVCDWPRCCKDRYTRKCYARELGGAKTHTSKSS